MKNKAFSLDFHTPKNENVSFRDYATDKVPLRFKHHFVKYKLREGRGKLFTGQAAGAFGLR
jgi:hypothetical protein